MYQVPNITDYPNQTLSLVLPDGVDTATLNLRYLANLKSWYMDLEYQDFSLNGRRVCSNPNLLRQWFKVLPFGLGCFTLDGSDPYFIEDFQEGRSGLVLLTEEEVDNFEQLLTNMKTEQ